MPHRKPEPPLVDGRYRYTLSSYDPVDVTLSVPTVTETEVGIGVAGIVREAGREDGSTPDDAWVAANLEGISSVAELRDEVRAQLERLNEQYAEATKPTLCAQALAERLEQSVPAAEVARMRESLRQGYEAQASRGGLTLEQAVAGMGMGPGDLDQMLDAQARDAAAQQAALDAVADERGVRVDETEIPGLLGLSPADARALIADARAHGQLDEVLRHAARRKASLLVASQCRCSYVRESPEQAARREEGLRQARASWDAAGSAGDANTTGAGTPSTAGNDAGDGEGGPHLRLV